MIVGLRMPDDGLYQQLLERSDEFAVAGIKSVDRIGDCLAPGALVHAIYSGHEFARQLDQTEQSLYLRDIPIAINPPAPAI